jgi:hypothetical protein
MGKELKSIESYIIQYLDRTFEVRDENVYDGERILYAYSLVSEIVGVFGQDTEVVHELVKFWCESKGVNWDNFSTTRKLKVKWSPELAQDLQAYYPIDAEAELTALLTEELAKEIDASILRDVQNLAQLQNRMANIGYQLSEPEFDAMSFTPIRYFERNG